uniref:RNA helicase n=1 Tax=Eptatretus burgeri TaxID=7764 RepID=A0A8C4QI36_EPTBU
MEAHLIPDIFKVDILWVQGPEEFWVQMPEYEQHWPNGAGCVEEPQLCSAEWLKSQTFIPGANVKRGQYCEVFWPKKKRWCRARVDAICQGMRNKTSCFLLDYNRSITVSSPSLQPPGEAFLHPVIRYKCSLGDVKPVGLLYDPLQDVVCLRPAEQWNMAARHYFKEAVEGSSLTHVQVLGLQNQTFNVRLFLGLSGDDKQLSVSYELVQRMFAFYLNKCLSHRCLILRGKTLEYGPPNSFGVYGSEKSLPASVSTLENGHTDDDYQHLSDLMKGEQWLPKMCATMVTKQKFEDVGTLSNGWSKENIKLDHVVACPDKDASKLPVVEAPTRPHTPLPLIHPNELAQFDLFSTHHLDCDPIKIDVGGKNTEVLESEFHKIYEDVEMRSEEDPAEQCLVNFMTPLACR